MRLPLNKTAGLGVPGAADIIGIAHPNAAMTVNNFLPYRKGECY